MTYELDEIHGLIRAYRILVRAGSFWDGTEPICCAIDERLSQIERVLPSPATTMEDVIARAAIAWHFADKDEQNGAALALEDSECCTKRPPAQLILAVLEFAEVRYV